MAENEHVGRKTLCTAEARDKIVERILAGDSLRAAAAHAGVDGSTPYDWMARGEKGEEPYKDFADRVHQAQEEVKKKKEAEAAELTASASNPVGRSTLCTPQLSQQIFDDLARGCDLKTAAEYAGIGKSTAEEWYRRGKSTGEEPYRSFYLGVRKFKAALKRRALFHLNKMMTEQGNVGAAKFLYQVSTDRRAAGSHFDTEVDERFDIEDLPTPDDFEEKS